MSGATYIDEKGRTWHRFLVDWTHELDGMCFSFDVWAIDEADAQERVAMIRQSATLAGRAAK